MSASLTFDAVELFLSLMETGSLSRSARVLGVSVTQASRLLSKLQEHFDEKLFVRTYQGMLPTPKAHSIEGAMRRIAQAYGELGQTQVFSPERLFRTFTIATTDNGMLCMLIPVIRRIRRVAPAVRFRILPIESDVLEKLKSGNVDLALYPIIDLPPKFHSLDLFHLQRVCLVRKGHPLAVKFQAGEALTEEDFNAYEKIFVGLSDETLSRPIYGSNTHLAQHQNTGIQVPYFMAAPFLLPDSDFTLFLPEPTAKFFAQILDLDIVTPPSDRFAYATRIVWHDRVHSDVESQWLRSLFVAYARPVAGDEEADLDFC